MKRIEIKEDETGSGGYVYAGGECVKYALDIEKYRALEGKEFELNTRYLAASIDPGPARGETDLIHSHGNGWRTYLVVA